MSARSISVKPAAYLSMQASGSTFSLVAKILKAALGAAFFMAIRK
jgi:hypothetical protein